MNTTARFPRKKTGVYFPMLQTSQYSVRTLGSMLSEIRGHNLGGENKTRIHRNSPCTTIHYRSPNLRWITYDTCANHLGLDIQVKTRIHRNSPCNTIHYRSPNLRWITYDTC